MKNILISMIAFFFMIGTLFAQTPDTLWSRIHDIAPDIDEGKCVRETMEGGYIITGSCVPDWGVSHIDVLLLKTDASGNILWTRVYDGNFLEEGLSVEQTFDGGYVVGGRRLTGSYPFYDPPISDAWILKTDLNGDTLWTKTYGGTGNDYCTSIRQTPDSGYVLTGTMHSEHCFPSYEINENYKPGTSKAWLIKTDPCGDTLWTRTYGERSHGNSVDRTSDGGYIVAGWIFPDEQDNQSDVYLIRTDSRGDTLWTKIIGGDDYDAGFCVRQTADGYVIAGQTKPQGKPYDGLLIKTDLTGGVLWSKTFGSALSDAAFSVDVSDDGYFITGSTNGTWWVTNKADMWAFQTDINGNLIWERILNIRLSDIGFSGIQSSDGGYVMTGMTSSGFGGDLWLAKLGQGSTSIDIKDTQSPVTDFILHQNYPNPFNAETTIFFELKESAPVTLKIYNLLGYKVQTVFQDARFPAGVHSVRVHAGRWDNGVYFYRLEANEGCSKIKKMCVLK